MIDTIKSIILKFNDLDKQILLSFFYRALGMIINFILVPITLDYLSPLKFGIWVTIYGFISRISFIDIGLGHGLRNKFAEAKTKKQFVLAKKYVSTAYFFVSVIMLLLFIMFIIIEKILNYGLIFNVSGKVIDEIRSLTFWAIVFFNLRFIFKLLENLLLAIQKPGQKIFIDLVSSFIILVSILILKHFSDNSLVKIGIIYTAVPLVILIISSFYYFNRGFKDYIPNINYVNKREGKVLIKLSLKFFIIQIASLILFQSDNFIIIHIFGPEAVTPYNISFRLFNFINVFFMLIVSPYWSAFTESNINNDFIWIKRILKKLIIGWFFMSVFVILLICFSPVVYKYWIGEEITIPLDLNLYMGIYAVLIAWNSIFVTYINGVGKLKIQFYIALIQAVLNIPLSFFLAINMDLGINGIILATIICLLISGILIPVQSYLIIHNKSIKIWNE